MEWTYIVKAKNNIHSDFPPLMSDSTLFTDWNTCCKTNNKLKKSSGITNNYNYRQWLINNGNSVMRTNRLNACNNANVKPSINNIFQKSDKYIFRDCNDTARPYGYETSDLKEIYLSKQELNEKLSAPIMTQYDLLKNGLNNYF
tara:strand:- start:162 stop:593 length:432 start_codon:yes stop_codon:yes gene_type:complete